ncbi:hypothetical protein E0H75_08425 [Kribbella capetownensis]|uniref:Uncharacterized protein n=1 Tax=Kribbella capetownensis TaxID=1572659 RepID=A0A4V2M923_9ACTN|nr:hypothetical protein [Kribbella capetownensis]TCC53692.1 hypothetical protein E0H75_08425 [Kribbella capetownensis]
MTITSGMSKRQVKRLLGKPHGRTEPFRPTTTTIRAATWQGFETLVTFADQVYFRWSTNRRNDPMFGA